MSGPRKGAQRLLDRAKKPRAPWSVRARQTFAAITSRYDAGQPLGPLLLNSLADCMETVPLDIQESTYAGTIAQAALKADDAEREQLVFDAAFELDSELGLAAAERREPDLKPLETFAAVWTIWTQVVARREGVPA